jgi:hypothetical protein
VSFVGAKGLHNLDAIASAFGISRDFGDPPTFGEAPTFGDSRPFHLLLFVYDGSDVLGRFAWARGAHVTVVHRQKQMKWWFVKHFVHPSTVEGAYERVMVVDEDADVSAFDPHVFLRTMHEFQVKFHWAQIHLDL